MIRLYIIPVIQIPLGGGSTYNIPAYLMHRLQTPLVGLEGVRWAWTTWLLEDVGILVADTTDTQNIILDSQPGVFPIPDLDATILNANIRNRVRNTLEAAFVPGTWIQTGNVYRNILRALAGMFEYHNRAVALNQGRFFIGSITLSTTISQLTTSQQAALSQAAGEFGVDYSGVTGTTNLRTVFLLANNLYNANRPFEIGGIVI